MFEKYDPGFLPGFIGLVMSIGLRYSYRWIKILYRFSKLFTELDELVKSNKNSSKVIELVEEARNVPWFKFIRRYQIGKIMDELISENNAYDLKEIVIDLKRPGGANKEIDQAVAEPGAAEERAVEEQTVGAQLDTPEEIIIGESPMIAGLRRRVGYKPEISEKIVLKSTWKSTWKSTMEDKRSQRRVMKAVAGAGVDSIAIDSKEGKITVIGEADPEWLATKLRKMGFKAEILSVGLVGLAKEEKKEEKKTEAPASCTIS